MPPRRPTRLLDKSNIDSAYPNELVADFATGDLALVDESGSAIEIPNSVSIETEGSGNAVTAIDASGHSIKVTKDASFLTEHPEIETEEDVVSEEPTTLDFGDEISIVKAVTRDENGHVLSTTTEVVVLPELPAGFSTDAELSEESENPVQNKVVTTALNGKATAVLYSATIGTTWDGSEAPYTQTITVTGITEDDVPIVDVNLSGISYANKDDVLSAYGKVYRITTGNNFITIYADEQTSTEIPIQLKIIE